VVEGRIGYRSRRQRKGPITSTLQFSAVAGEWPDAMASFDVLS